MATKKKKKKSPAKKNTTAKKQSTTKEKTAKKSTVNKNTTKKNTAKTTTKRKKAEPEEIIKYNKLYDYDINKKKKKDTSKYLNKFKIMLLSLCKVVLIALTSIIKFFIKQYNIIRDKILTLHKEQKLKRRKRKYNKLYDKPIKMSKTTDKKIYDYENEDDDEVHKLRYRDYEGLAKITVFFINRIRVMKFDMKKFKKKFKYGTFKDKLLIVLMLLLILGFSAILAFCIYIVVSAPAIDTDRLYTSNSSILYDMNGEEIARLGVEKREKVTYEELPEVLVDAIVATEDSRFFQHNGIDIARFTKAVIGQLLGRSDAGGGSTLTMQVSKNAATTNESHGIEGIIRKFTDIYLSVFVFEKKYTKEQIMEFYVNIPFLGSGSYGVEQASQTYFGKSVSELNLAEAATIAGLFQAPSSYDPYAFPNNAEKRRNTVLNLMYRHGYISEEERDTAKEVPIKSLLIGQNTNKNQYQGFIDTVVKEVVKRTGNDPYTSSMIIYTTLNPDKQKVVNGIMTGETYKWTSDYSEAGIAVVSVDDGSIAAIGNGRNQPVRGFNYATDINRHPGSTAKPVADYGPAIEYLGWGTGQTLIDDKMTYSSGASIKNFDNGFKGIMTAKTALAQSRNIPALYTFQQTTSQQKLEFAEGLGWKLQDDGYGNVLESVSIGGFEGVSPLQSAAAYATFARGGLYIEPHSFTKIEYPETGEEYILTPKTNQVMSEETAFLVTTILKYAVTSGSVGVGSVSGTEIAAKTGTSTVDSAKKKALGIKAAIIGDSWENAYDSEYSISTWYGYPTLTKDHYLTSKEGGTARKAITKILTVGIFSKNKKFSVPKGITTATIELESDPLELASDYTPDNLKSVEYFKKGTQPTTVSNRFAQLSNPSNLKYSSTDTTVSLSWNAAPTPDAINHTYLQEYFSNSTLYSRWGEQYLQNRINYNNSVFGTFGYEIYMITPGGTVDLGFTTDTKYTVNVQFSSNTSFVVKSAYQNFKSNQSSGIQVNVEANHQPEVPQDPNTQPTTQQQGNQTFSIEYLGKYCLQSFQELGAKPSDKIRVKDASGNVITNQVSTSYECFDANDDRISCNNLAEGTQYDIVFTVRYNGTTRNKRITLKPAC